MDFARPLRRTGSDDATDDCFLIAFGAFFVGFIKALAVFATPNARILAALTAMLCSRVCSYSVRVSFVEARGALDFWKVGWGGVDVSSEQRPENATRHRANSALRVRHGQRKNNGRRMDRA